MLTRQSCNREIYLLSKRRAAADMGNPTNVAYYVLLNYSAAQSI